MWGPSPDDFFDGPFPIAEIGCIVSVGAACAIDTLDKIGIDGDWGKNLCKSMDAC
jgi:hypothetical protein